MDKELVLLSVDIKRIVHKRYRRSPIFFPRYWKDLRYRIKYLLDLTKNYKRTYVILPYADGQVFQFGPDFREDDSNASEFVYLPEHRNTFKIPPFFQITCTEGAFFLNNIESQEEVEEAEMESGIWRRFKKKRENTQFLCNNKVVKTGVSLNVGDIIEIPYPMTTKHRTPWGCRAPHFYRERKGMQTLWDWEKPLKFLFSERRWPKSKESVKVSKQTPRAIGQVLENPYILSKIFGYLPIPTLKSVRLVSRLWSCESLTRFKSLSASTLRISDYHDPLQSMTFFRYLQDMSGFGPHSNLKLYLRSFHSWMIDEPEKFVYDSAKFLASPALHFQRVSICLGDNSDAFGFGRYSSHYTMNPFVCHLLKSKLSENIEELELTVELNLLPFEGGCTGYIMYQDPDPEPWTLLPSLQSVALEFVWISEITSSEPCQDVVRWLLPFCKEIHSISLTSLKSWCNTLFLKEMTRQSMLEDGFVNWSKIKISRIDADGLQCLQKLGGDGKLKKIEILEFEDDCKITELGMLLQKHATVLEEVILHVPPAWESCLLSYSLCITKEVIIVKK